MKLQDCLAIAAFAASPARCLSPRIQKRASKSSGSGGLTILSYNDLTNNPPADSAAILVNDASKFSTVAASCEKLDEALWNPDDTVFEHGLNSSLSYQVFRQTFPEDQLFWVAGVSEEGSECRAIDYKGTISEVDCADKLPGLCTQSAPVSTMETNDDPTDFHINHAVGKKVYTGFRDFFVWKFRGIRYAAQPERFEHSTVYKADEDELIPALKAGAECVQPIGEVQEGMDEDCLFLNVWTPYLPPAGDVSKEKLKPVMFYIYGGGFTSGSGKNPNTDSTNLASRGDVVAVSINYRVSNLGFLSLNDGVHDGNYGLGDMVTALKWVQENIAAFGGDPSQVTIFGESAGAMGVRALLASSKAKGLFANAISQSGPAGLIDNENNYLAFYDSLEHTYNTVTKGVLTETGCADAEDAVECLRQIDAHDLVNLENVANGLIIDGVLLDVEHLPVDGTGLTGDVALMTGTNRDELGVDMDTPPEGTSIFTLLEVLGNMWGDSPGPLLQTEFFELPDPYYAADALHYAIWVGTDGLYTCMEHATSYAAAQNHAFEAVYSFMFNRTYSPTGYTKPHCEPPATAEFPNGDPNLEYYKCHAGEQMIVFGNILRDSLPDRDGLDVPFMQLVVDYWTTFAWNRDPNPTKEYLEARGYTNTLNQVEAVGPWNAVEGDENLRMLQWDGGHVPLPEIPQCETLGIELDFWSRN